MELTPVSTSTPITHLAIYDVEVTGANRIAHILASMEEAYGCTAVPLSRRGYYTRKRKGLMARSPDPIVFGPDTLAFTDASNFAHNLEEYADCYYVGSYRLCDYPGHYA